MKVLFKILEDEFLRGYYGRLAGFNDCDSLRDLTAMLLQQSESSMCRENAKGLLLKLAAELNGLSPDALVADHTCYCVLHNVGDTVRVAECGNQALSHLSFSLIRPLHPGWKMCMACIEQDLADLRFSYWRRRHQVPGAFRCPIHHTPLALVPGLHWIGEAPADAIVRARVPSVDEYEGMARNVHIDRAVSLLDTIATKRITLDRATCQAAVQARAASEGEAPSTPGWFARFSARLDEMFTREWMQGTLFKSKLRAGQVRYFAFGAFSPNSELSHAALAIVASAVFPSAAQALRAFGFPAGRTVEN